MLPSGIATLLCSYLADHPALAFTLVQGAVYDSSPKYHAQPVGLPLDESLKVTVSGAVPVVGVPEKFATGAEDTFVLISSKEAPFPNRR
jgi:hypothetical protein